MLTESVSKFSLSTEMSQCSHTIISNTRINLIMKRCAEMAATTLPLEDAQNWSNLRTKVKPVKQVLIAPLLIQTPSLLVAADSLKKVRNIVT